MSLLSTNFCALLGALAARRGTRGAASPLDALIGNWPSARCSQKLFSKVDRQNGHHLYWLVQLGAGFFVSAPSATEGNRECPMLTTRPLQAPPNQSRPRQPRPRDLKKDRRSALP